jgi:hypothetical protein
MFPLNFSKIGGTASVGKIIKECLVTIAKATFPTIKSYRKSVRQETSLEEKSWNSKVTPKKD